MSLYSFLLLLFLSLTLFACPTVSQAAGVSPTTSCDLSASSCISASYPITISWSSTTNLPYDTRGQACMGLLSDGQSLDARYVGGFVSDSINNWTNWEFQKDPRGNDWAQFTNRSGVPYGIREGHGFLFTQNDTSGDIVEVVWGGRNSTLPSSVGAIPDVWRSVNFGPWQLSYGPYAFLQKYNMSYTVVKDSGDTRPLGPPQPDHSNVGFWYGGVQDPAPLQTGPPAASPYYYVVNVDGTISSDGNAYSAPWGARLGMSASSFNGTAGVVVLMGGASWPQDGITPPSFYNDVWVTAHMGIIQDWQMVGTAPWSPRWGHQVWNGGRGDLILLGGLIGGGTNSWVNDVWYGVWDITNPFIPPNWTHLPSTAGAPTSVAACSMVFWQTDATLLLIAMGSKTGMGYNPTNQQWIGTVTYN